MNMSTQKTPEARKSERRPRRSLGEAGKSTSKMNKLRKIISNVLDIILAFEFTPEKKNA